jgi:hypothetical protein
MALHGTKQASASQAPPRIPPHSCLPLLTKVNLGSLFGVGANFCFGGLVILFK